MEVSERAVFLPWQGAGLTDIGRVRESNQDAFAVDNELGLWVVADGMGGHAGGHVASDLAVKSVVEHVRTENERESVSSRKQADVARLLSDAVLAGDLAIRERMRQAPNLAGMGTTLVAALLGFLPEPHLVIAHIGDSRAYLIRDQTIRLLTVDHSFVQRLINEGHISPEDARRHPQQHVLLKALGALDNATPDIYVQELASHDTILICTDGLTKTVSEEVMLATVSSHGTSTSQACQELIHLANTHGGQDNITVVLVSASAAHQ